MSERRVRWGVISTANIGRAAVNPAMVALTATTFAPVRARTSSDPKLPSPKTSGTSTTTCSHPPSGGSPKKSQKASWASALRGYSAPASLAP